MKKATKIRYYKDLARILGIIALFALGWIASLHLRENTTIIHFINHYGYSAIFIVALVGGFNLLVPIPAISFLPLYVASGLDHYVVFLVIAIGTTCADVLGYYLGKIGRRFASSRTEKRVARLDRWHKKYRFLPLTILFLFAAFVPLPNEIFIVPMGFLRYNIALITLVVFIGNLLFNILTGLGVISTLSLFS